MHSFHPAQSTYFGLNGSCSKSCVCVDRKDFTWGVTTPADQHQWCLLTSHLTPCSSACVGSWALRLISRGRQVVCTVCMVPTQRCMSDCLPLQLLAINKLLTTTQGGDPALAGCQSRWGIPSQEHLGSLQQFADVSNMVPCHCLANRKDFEKLFAIL